MSRDHYGPCSSRWRCPMCKARYLGIALATAVVTVVLLTLGAAALIHWGLV